MTAIAKAANKTLQEIDAVIEDFSADEIARSLQDTYKDHLRAAEGYDPERLASEYEIITRIAGIIQERGRILQEAHERREAYEAAQKDAAAK